MHGEKYVRGRSRPWDDAAVGDRYFQLTRQLGKINYSAAAVRTGFWLCGECVCVCCGGGGD